MNQARFRWRHKTGVNTKIHPAAIGKISGEDMKTQAQKEGNWSYFSKSYS